VQNEQISVLQVGPTLLQMLVDEDMGRCTSLRRIFSGGEPLSAELHNRLSRQLAVPLINLYGPTEAAIDVTSYVCSEDRSPGSVPIGRPIANTEIYILDRHQQPVPIGVAGELHIGGAGLARGYLNRPELTREKFIANPFSADPLSRLYKTGDLARFLPDGNIEFIGRIDNQVKIRGYRIELGEIEAVLGQHPSVQSSTVVVREDAPVDRRLVAYIVENKGSSAEALELRGYLKNKLPDYMVPSAFVFMDALPLTPNGKIDRSKLPMPESSQRSEFVAPRTPVEQNIAQIWAEVLRVDRVGIDDNFFDLGGHSLLATQVISRMRGVFNYDIPLRSLFEAPTVEDLAMMIIRQQAEKVSHTEMERLLDDVEAVPGEMVRAATKRQ
jgi:acyl-coenzyme A synthetase/AMP-(fatty) acid ligase/acyl carrier protein